jgi:transcriptional regulator with AAA-type ATPase domain
MSLFTPAEWAFAETAADLVTTNPFHSSWADKERNLLGHPARYTAEGYSWRPGLGLWGEKAIDPELAQIGSRINALSDTLRERLRAGRHASPQELERYETLSLYRLYTKVGEALDRSIDDIRRTQAARRDDDRDSGKRPALSGIKPIWDDFRRDHDALLGNVGVSFALNSPPEHLFACFFLLRRAFFHIFFNIVGASRPAARLRGNVWESIVTHDLRGWSQNMYGRMRDFPTLITGPSGTGKELVAQAIGRSLYIPFDPVRKAYAIDFRDAFRPINLSALPPLLIEAELFGHVKGAFASAVRDRKGRLEECPEYGAVFLDEIGELTPEIQVKLLRVLQTRRFQSVGENEDRSFLGKIIAATNRDLAAELHAGRFREDFYFRLCADRIATPSLRDQLADCPADLTMMVEFICQRVVGAENAAKLTAEVVDWIEKHPQLGRNYAWPGNFRELEQCVRSYTIRKAYLPVPPAPMEDSAQRACETLAEAILNRTLAYGEIERRLLRLVHARTGSYQEAARLLGVDWRTLRRRVAESCDDPPEPEL